MLVYKLDILAALKNNGYTTYRIKSVNAISIAQHREHVKTT